MIFIICDDAIYNNSVCCFPAVNNAVCCVIAGTLPDFGDMECRIPVMLIQRPTIDGNTSASKRSVHLDTGYGSGWDIVLPTNWAMPFWIAFVYRGAKPCGLRDLRSLSMESGLLVSPDCCPETVAASEASNYRAAELRADYLRRPPAKRCNYEKLGIPAPFHCPWPQLVAGWSGKDAANNSAFYCLRNRKWLLKIAELSTGRGETRTAVPLDGASSTGSYPLSLPFATDSCIVRVTVRLLGRGVPSRFSSICQPVNGDLSTHSCRGKRSGGSGPVEPIHRVEKSDNAKNDSLPPSADVVNAASRRIFGFVVEGGYSHYLGRGFGVGFVTLPGLVELLGATGSQFGKPVRVLVRSTTSLHYHVADLALMV